MDDIEVFQRFISKFEENELEELKKRIYKEEPDPPPIVQLYPDYQGYNYADREVTPSYFQVERYPEVDLFLDAIDNDDFLRCKRTKKSSIVSYEVASILSTDPDFNIIRESLMNTAESTRDTELYQKTIKGLATLIMSLYTPETLYRRHHARSHHNQSNELWNQIQQPKPTHSIPKTIYSIPAFCNAITHHNINYNQYPLVTQADTDHFITHYVSQYIYSETKTRRLRAPNASFPLPQRKQNDMFNEIHEIVAGMECPKRMKKVDLDDYTRLLIKLASENSQGKDHELVDRVMAVINTSCEVWKSEMKFYVLCMIRSEQWRIKNMSSRVTDPLYNLVYKSDKFDPLVCADVWDIIEVAGFRREALGSRFIKRNHLVWAFYELGFGLPLGIFGKFNWIEDEDRPHYHMYLASIKLAQSLGNEIVQLHHFIFAVLFLKDMADDKDLAPQMKELFTVFLRDAAWDNMMRPNDQARSWLKKVHESTPEN